MAKAAFAVWGGRIAPIFDVARKVQLFEVADGRVAREIRELPEDDLPVQRALRLVEMGVGTLVCGAISRHLQEMVAAYGIRVVPFVAGDLPEVENAWLSGGLDGDRFAMPGCRKAGRRRIREERDFEKEGRGMFGRRRGGAGQSAGPGRGADGPRGGRMGGPLAAGPAGNCVCPQCGRREPHERGVPCTHRKCPVCGVAMARE